MQWAIEHIGFQCQDSPQRRVDKGVGTRGSLGSFSDGASVRWIRSLCFYRTSASSPACGFRCHENSSSVADPCGLLDRSHHGLWSWPMSRFLTSSLSLPDPGGMPALLASHTLEDMRRLGKRSLSARRSISAAPCLGTICCIEQRLERWTPSSSFVAPPLAISEPS